MSHSMGSWSYPADTQVTFRWTHERCPSWLSITMVTTITVTANLQMKTTAPSAGGSSSQTVGPVALGRLAGHHGGEHIEDQAVHLVVGSNSEKRRRPGSPSPQRARPRA